MKIKPYIPFSLLRIFLITGCILFLFFKYRDEHPRVEWDTSADKVVISYEVVREIEYGFIPDFRVWGDGHIVWVKYEANSTREVYEGYLSQDQLKNIINQFVDSGYYHWFGNGGEAYENINIRLIQRPYSSLSIDSNTEISKLVQFLRDGAGVEAKEFVPTVGYLYVFPIEDTEYSAAKITPVSWPRDKYQIPIEDFKELFLNGYEISGKELDFVWSIVNNSSFIKLNGRIYRIALKIPNVTY